MSEPTNSRLYRAFLDSALNLPRWCVSALIRWQRIQWLLAVFVSRLPKDQATTSRFFDLCQSKGWHVTPVHYYQPIPDTRCLSDEMWTSRSDLVGIDLNIDWQLAFLSEISASFKPEYDAFPDERTSCPYEYYFNNPNILSCDSEIQYCMIRKFRPKKIFEIGSGTSTLVSAAAIRKNEELYGEKCQLTAIEPYPNPTLQEGFPGLSELIVAPVEEVPLARFAELEENDILFIDSSHVVRIGGDVRREYLEIIPRLRNGVLVHMHDIFMPADYPKTWIMQNHWFWTEQYLLQAFLSFNSSYEVLWSASYMHLTYPDRLEACFRAYQRSQRWPASFWMRKKQ